MIVPFFVVDFFEINKETSLDKESEETTFYFSFVVIMSFHFQNKDFYHVIVNVINDSVMSRDAPRPGNVPTALQWLRMPHTCSWMFKQILVDFLVFLEQVGV